jgi:hypothetical protein
MRSTCVAVPCELLGGLRSLTLRNQSSFVRAAIESFIASKDCNAVAIARLPYMGKVARIGLWLPPATTRSYQKTAAKVADGSLSLLVTAALAKQVKPVTTC